MKSWYQNSIKKKILRKQKKQKDYWDKYEDYSWNLSLDELNYDKFNLDLLNFDNKRAVVIKDEGKKKGPYKSLRNNKGEVLLNNNKHILKLV